MFRNMETAKTIEFNFIIVIRVIVLPKESYSPFISYDYYSIKNYERKFQNTFRNGFSSFVSGQKMRDKYRTKNCTKLADDVPLSIRSNETRFINIFYLFFHVNLSL